MKSIFYEETTCAIRTSIETDKVRCTTLPIREPECNQYQTLGIKHLENPVKQRRTVGQYEQKHHVCQSY